jgi:methylglutaconyl-CoA hydratase
MGESSRPVTVRVEDGTAHVRLARPGKRNAFDDEGAAALAGAFADVGGRDDVRVVVLGGEGKVFCAGGDLAWMRRVADYDRDENLRDAAAFQAAYEAIDRCPRPVVARVQGAALGGGAGLAAACDVVVAAADARFGFPEVRLGLVPGVISPYVIRRLGAGTARALFLTGEVFGADEALRVGLADRVVPAERLDDAVAEVVAHLRAGAPDGLRRVKALVRDVATAPDPATAAEAARRAIAEARASDDGREGTRAFLERREPGWRR